MRYRHGALEHDASLSRGDAHTGDNVSFNETIFKSLTETNPDTDYYDASSSGAALRRRLRESQAVNPSFSRQSQNIAIRTLENSIYLAVMGDPLTGVAPKE
jgi:hypothetical protein